MPSLLTDDDEFALSLFIGERGKVSCIDTLRKWENFIRDIQPFSERVYSVGPLAVNVYLSTLYGFRVSSEGTMVAAG